MKKKLVLFALAAFYAAAPAKAAPAALSPYQEALAQSAYVMGRCYVYLNDELKVSAVSFYNSQSDDELAQMLQSLYYSGIQDSQINGLTFTQCKRLIAKSKEELERLKP